MANGGGPYLANWGRGDLADPPPRIGRAGWAALLGPGLVMVGANIGGGEWLFGPVVTARYGGMLMWLATLSIAFQAFFNLAAMRYTLWTGEPIFVGFLRTPPGPKFWLGFYLLMDLGYIWPYLASNAAVPAASLWLGRLPGPEDDALVRNLGYVVYLAAFVPLIFGAKIYNVVEKIMLAKVVLVLGYLLVVDLFMVSASTWVEVFTGFAKFGALPDAEIDWATLAAFAAVAGAGGLSNTLFSNYARDKGWGMGGSVGAIPGLVGGKKIALSRTGKTFELNESNLARWRGWISHILRDQVWVWCVGCILGMALPALLSVEFIRGAEVDGHAAAAMTARGIADRYGEFFWYSTLACGFLVFAPAVVQTIDGIVRRWTDVIWSARGGRGDDERGDVRKLYYGIMAAYCLWGLLALNLTPNPLVLAIAGSVLGNIGLGAAALHVLVVNRRLMPKQLQPHPLLQIGLLGTFVFFLAISGIALAQQLNRLAG